MNTYTPVVLIIRDGWGANHDSGQDAYNAVKLANIPYSRELSAHWPRTELKACGLDVGLPVGVMGNSEVGHQNIGAGRIVDQEIVRIDKALAESTLAHNPVLSEGFANAQRPGKALHFMGLISDAGVHSTLEHLYGLWRLAIDAGVTRIFIHALTDGRDTPPKSGLHFIEAIEARAKHWGLGQVATVCGRYWAMDRDKRWDRVQSAYDCLVGRGELRLAASATQAVEAYYDKPLDATRVGDEFILPTAVTDAQGQAIGRVEAGDSVIFFNFRGDRPRELTRAFIEPNFIEFDRGPYLNPCFITLTEYEKGLCPRVLFLKPEKMKGILGEVVSQAGLKQFRVAETEKYPHVTFFFNDYRDAPFPGEDWQLIQSPKDVPTYDLKPRMSAEGVAAAARE
ncbi:MAG: phosphoglycerate mutase (2,3-diphosphoglycerate-independent), partial [Verrucomicrobia bacterium 21-51-4]